MSPAEFVFDLAPKTCCEILDLTASAVIFYWQDLCSPESEDLTINRIKFVNCAALFRHCRKLCTHHAKTTCILLVAWGHSKDVTINVAFVKFPVSGLMFSLLGRYELWIITEEWDAARKSVKQLHREKFRHFALTLLQFLHFFLE